MWIVVVEVQTHFPGATISRRGTNIAINKVNLLSKFSVSLFWTESERAASAWILVFTELGIFSRVFLQIFLIPGAHEVAVIPSQDLTLNFLNAVTKMFWQVRIQSEALPHRFQDVQHGSSADWNPELKKKKNIWALGLGVFKYSRNSKAKTWGLFPLSADANILDFYSQYPLSPFPDSYCLLSILCAI